MWEQEDEGETISVRQTQGKSCQENVCFQTVSVSGKTTFKKSQLHPRVPFPEFKKSVLKQLVIILACCISGWLSHLYRAVFCMLFRIFIPCIAHPIPDPLYIMKKTGSVNHDKIGDMILDIFWGYVTD